MSVEVLKQIWPEWQIEGKPLGKGSFGVVYKAVRRDHNVESYAAIKVISIPADPSEVDSLRSEGLDMNATRTYLQGIVNDFISEIQLMESLKGVQNIVSVEDYKVVEKTDEIGWDIYIRMELLTPFNTYICDKKLTEEEVIKLGCDICTALEICGKRNIIHRDIKPENIFINDFGYFKLGDFGIARKMENMTGGLSQKGTFNYMAPEVATSSEYDARVDTYSLGIVLYRLLNGNRLPFLDTEKQLLNPNERRNAVDRRIRGEELPAPCEASPAMADLILRACAYDPGRRFSSATEMKQALMSVANGTYLVAASNLDGTIPVRRVPSDYDKTTPVRQATNTSDRKNPPEVNTFGAKPKKKKKIAALIAVVLALLLLVSVGIFVVPNLFDDKEDGESGKHSGDTTTEKAETYKSIEEEIAYIISQADALAAQKDYKSAIAKVQAGLATYPDSTELKNKEDEYTEKLNNEAIASIISEADALAAQKDYKSALAKVQAGLATYPNSTELKNKLDEYTKAQNEQIKETALATAKSLSDAGDHLAALQTVNQALKSVGADSALTAAAKTYEDAYAKSVSAQVDAYLAEQNITAAKQLLETASKEIPNNAVIKALKNEVDKYKTILLSSLTPINGKFPWNEGSPSDPLGNDYSNVENFVILHSGTWSAVHQKPNSHSVEYTLSKKFSTISFQLSPYVEMNNEGFAYVQIFVNGVLRYTSPYITQKSGIVSVVGIDVSDAEYITITVENSGWGCLLMSNVMLDSIPNFVSKIDKKYTSLSQFDCLNGNIEWHNNYPEDILGNNYSSVQNYTVFHSGTWSAVHQKPNSHSAEYFIAKKYSSLVFDISPYIEFGKEGKAQIKIYTDDNLVYTSPIITQKTVKFNTGSIDLEDVNYLRFEVTMDGWSCTMISDVLLENVQ